MKLSLVTSLLPRRLQESANSRRKSHSTARKSSERPLYFKKPKSQIEKFRSTRPLSRHSLLLALPYEIRHHILLVALSRPRRWEWIHDPSCSRYDPHARINIPPFVMMRENFYRGDFSPLCQCTRRGALSLLLSCRQIYDESVVLLYSMNAFCFDNDCQFQRTMLAANPEVFHFVHHVSIVESVHDTGCPTSMDQKDLCYNKHTLALIGLASMRCLRTLDIGLCWAKKNAKELVVLRNAIPKLEELNITRMGSMVTSPRPMGENSLNLYSGKGKIPLIESRLWFHLYLKLPQNLSEKDIHLCNNIIGYNYTYIVDSIMALFKPWPRQEALEQVVINEKPFFQYNLFVGNTTWDGGSFVNARVEIFGLPVARSVSGYTSKQTGKDLKNEILHWLRERRTNEWQLRGWHNTLCPIHSPHDDY